MNYQKLDCALILVSEFITGLKVEGEIIPGHDFDIIIMDQEEGSLFLSDQEARNYQKTLFELSSCFDEDIISKNKLEHFFNKTILRSLDLQNKRSETPLIERVSNEISNLRALLLQKPKEYVIYYPVFGLSPFYLPFYFGGVSFEVFNEDHKKLFINFKKTSKQASSNQKQLENDFETYVNSGPIIGKPVGIMSIQAVDSDAAETAAIKKLRLTLGVLNFLCGLIPYNNGAFFLPSEMSMEVINVPKIEKNGEDKPTFATNRVGPLGDISMGALNTALSKQKIDKERVSKLVENQKRNNFEQRLVSAMNWAGKAKIEQVREKAFLLYAISLEALILQDCDRDELLNRLCTRVAILIGKNLDQRLTIRKHLKELYSIRSSIVHDGKYEVTKIDLSWMESFTVQSIFRILNDEPFINMTSTKDLIDWFDIQIFS